MLAQDVLIDLDRLAAAKTRGELEAQLVQLKRQQAESQETQAAIASLTEALQRPAYWQHGTVEGATAPSGGFETVRLNRHRDGETLALLEKMLETHDPSELGKGADLKWKSSEAYDTLKLVHAWRIENVAQWDKYAAGRKDVAQGVKRIISQGHTVRASASRLHETSSKMPGGMDEGAQEEMLLHGTSVDLVNDILATGMNERFSGISSGTAFGDGIYFADDCAKCDHYVIPHQRLDTQDKLGRLYADEDGSGGSSLFRHNVGYIFVCRVALGHHVRTKTKFDKRMKSMDTGEHVFAQMPNGRSTMRELSLIKGVEPPVRHHSLIAESHASGGPYRYREYVVFHDVHVYPEYLIAYTRTKASRAD